MPTRSDEVNNPSFELSIPVRNVQMGANAESVVVAAIPGQDITVALQDAINLACAQAENLTRG